MQHGRQRLGPLVGEGSRNGTPESLIVRFALEMRCAIVASGTRKALAISAVVSPPTARSVSAIDEAGVSAGWAHMNSRASVSSSSTTEGSGGSSTAVWSSRLDRACSLRT